MIADTLRISGASSTLANTPNVNSTTGFTSGAGINAATTQQFILNTAAQTDSDTFGVAVLEYSNTTVQPRVIYMTTNINVSGVTQKRLTLGFTNPSGGAFGLTTADGNIASGQFVAVRIVGAIS